MTPQRRILSLLGTGLLVANLAWAATPTAPTTPPTPTTPTVPTTPTTPTLPTVPPLPTTPDPTTPQAATPTLLWIYGDPNPQWVILDYFETAEGCELAIETMVVTPPQDIGCFPGSFVDPARLHEKYGTLSVKP